MSIVVDAAEVLLFGYLVAVVAFLCFGFLVTRLGRNLLMSDDRMNPIYFILMSLAWIIAAASGAFASFNLAPFGQLGSWVFTLGTGLILIAVLFRNHAERRHQQSMTVNIIFSLCIMVGCVAGDLLRLRSIAR